jgi:CheY-like chemotaxis protein
VDPDKNSAEGVASLLRDMGSDVEIAQDGPSALALDRTFRPVEECQRGTITEEEFAVRAFECAGRFDPAEIAHAIPEALLEVVRRFAASPPQDTSDVSPDWWLAFDDYEIERRREAAFQGAWNWSRFFNP